MTPEQASDFYAEHYGKMFFPSLIAYMSRYAGYTNPLLCLLVSQWAGTSTGVG